MLKILFFLLWLLPLTHCRCRDLLLHLIILSDTHTNKHSVRILEIGPSRRLLPDYTKHSQTTPGPLPPAGFEPAIPGSELPRARTLNRMTTWIGVIAYRAKSHRGIEVQLKSSNEMRNHKPSVNENTSNSREFQNLFFHVFGNKIKYSVLKIRCFMITKLCTDETGYDVGLYDTWHKTSDILWYQLIPHC